MNVHTRPYGRTVSLHWTVRCHPLTSYCLGENLSHATSDHGSTERLLKSWHPQDEANQEPNQQRQVKQAEFYNRRSGNDRRILRNKEPVFVRDTLRNIWKPAVVLDRPQPT